MNRERSDEMYRRACRVMPGGVSSPVRAFRAVGGTPIYFQEAARASFTDLDGNSYIDFVMSWGPLILGHAHPETVRAVQLASARGLSYGAPCRDEVALAEKVVASYPGCEMVRFVSSGTEAVMAAIRLARGVTGRSRMLKFDGCYHGHSDSLLVKAGSGLATFATASSAGVPASLAALTAVIPLDDAAALEAVFSRYGDELAAAVIEPVPANAGLLLQRRELLARLAELCHRHGALLVFDEVISGFRLDRGGAAARLGITPDLATFGKVIGGGLPVGAYGGRRELMECVAPLGPVYQAGTLSGNPVAMAAGLTTLDVLEQEHGWTRLEQLGATFEALVVGTIRHAGVPASLVRTGSVFWLSLQEGEPPRRFDRIDPRCARRYARLHAEMLDRGVYMAPSAYEVGFLSTAHVEADLESFAEALRPALAAAFS
jgi:glutamate-1-semialdehyde 2,1-aminomutase